MAIVLLLAASILPLVLILPLFILPSLYFFLADTNSLNFNTVAVFSIVMFAIPIVSLFFGTWVQEYFSSKSLLLLCGSLGLVLGFSKNILLLQLDKLNLFLNGKIAISFLAVLNNSILCAAICALAVLTLSLVIELPLRWLERGFQVKLRFCFPVFRHLIFCLALAGISGLIIETIITYVA